MQKIVEWLEQVEEQAFNLYTEASVLFKDDLLLYPFLTRLARDEALHARLMNNLAGYLRDNHIELEPIIRINRATVDLVEAPLKQAHEIVAEGNLSRKQLIDLIVEIEYFEWNNVLFRYAVTSVKPYSKAFQRAAAVIQAHENRISRFLDTLPDDLKPSKDMSELSPIWKSRFLVVEDDEAVSELLFRVLARRGRVDKASNGAEALEKMENQFFDAIISDVKMPVMDGLEFFQRALEEDPTVSSRFMFCSGHLSAENKEFLKSLGVRSMSKPFSLEEISRWVDGVVSGQE